MSRRTPPATAERAAPTDPGGIVLRPLETYAEYRACVDLQRATWGADFTECVPAAILMVGQKIGGITAGAFGPDGRLLGFVFGLTGILDGRPVHWSDMLAVRDEARGWGLGRRLKVYQRELLLERGVDVAYWTYDPLVARNAHLNLNRLGAEVLEYVQDMYGADTASELHSGLGTDRFVVLWRLRSRRVEQALAGHPPDFTPFRDAPVVNAEPEAGGPPVEKALPDAPAVRVEVPADIQAVKAASRETPARWRTTTRRAFLHYLSRGYRVAGFHHDAARGRAFYGLASGAPLEP